MVLRAIVPSFDSTGGSDSAGIVPDKQCIVLSRKTPMAVVPAQFGSRRGSSSS